MYYTNHIISLPQTPQIVITLEMKYETEKYIAFKTNKIRQFKKKWEMFEVFHLI